MKKGLVFLLTISIFIISCSGCNNKKNKVGVDTSNINGIYVPLELEINYDAVTTKDLLLNQDVDAYCEYVEFLYNDLLNGANDFQIGCHKAFMDVLEFNDNNFSEYYTQDQFKYLMFSGNYTVENDEIKFHYDKVISYRPSSQFDYSTGDIKEFGLESEEWGDRLYKLNKSNMTVYYPYPSFMKPQTRMDWGILPCPIGAGIDVVYIDGEYMPKYLKKCGDFLCRESVSMELAGDYTLDEDFTIRYNPHNAFYDWYYAEDDALRNNLEKQFIDTGITGDNKIYFSNGTWTWKNEEGRVINEGKYTESKNHPGLVMMSSNLNKEAYVFLALYFEDDKIYYPHMIKIENIIPKTH